MDIGSICVFFYSPAIVVTPSHATGRKVLGWMAQEVLGSKVRINGLFHLHSCNLTQQWKMGPLKMYFLLQMVICHCYVSLPEGAYKFLEPFDDPCFDWNFGHVLGENSLTSKNRGHGWALGNQPIYPP